MVLAELFQFHAKIKQSKDKIFYGLFMTDVEENFLKKSWFSSA
jgi:hypothetical protein